MAGVNSQAAPTRGLLSVSLQEEKVEVRVWGGGMGRLGGGEERRNNCKKC